MKLRVQGYEMVDGQVVDGRIEVITLVPPIEIHDGDTLWEIRCADGTDHFFRTETGHYDGWGRMLAPPPEGSPEDALKLAKDINDQREFPEEPKP